MSHATYGPWGATNLGEGGIGEISRVVRRKVGKVVIPIVAPRTGLPRALVLEVVLERRLVVAVEVVPGEVVEAVVGLAVGQSRGAQQERLQGGLVAPLVVATATRAV